MAAKLKEEWLRYINENGTIHVLKVASLVCIELAHDGCLELTAENAGCIAVPSKDIVQFIKDNERILKPIIGNSFDDYLSRREQEDRKDKLVQLAAQSLSEDEHS